MYVLMRASQVATSSRGEERKGGKRNLPEGISLYLADFLKASMPFQLLILT